MEDFCMSKRIMVLSLALTVALVATFAVGDETAKAKTKPAKAAAVAKSDAPAKADAPAAAEKAPRLTIIEPLKDFGTVPKGEKIDWSFSIKNTGDADLQILAAKPGCGCTVADFDKVIKPGQTGKVTAHVDTTAFNGPIQKSVTVESNDPGTPSAQLSIHAIVKPYVEAYPAGFVRYNLLQGDADTQSFTIYSEEEEPLEILGIDVPGDYVKATYSKIEKAEDLAKVGRQGQTQYKVNITVGGPSAPIGPLADKVRIRTNSKHQPEYLVTVSGLIRPTLRVEPTSVNFGEITASDPAGTRSVLLHSNDLKTPGNFVVTKAESSNPNVSTEVKPSPNAGEYEVSVKLNKDAKPGDIAGTVKIYTSDKINPVITVPVSGTVKSAAPSK
jgi:hypothetical protein